MSQKRPRADALRNRERVLAVAEAVFAEEGLGVPIDEIAKRAKLGVGTLYRHFPTKEALFAAIVVGRVERVVAEALALALADDPGAAFFGFIGRLVDEGLAKKDFVDALAGSGVDIAHIDGAKADFRRALAALLRRAQRAGAVRPDVGAGEVVALVAGLHTASLRAGDARTKRRLLAVVCDGLRRI